MFDCFTLEARQKKFTALQQCLQYGVISNTKPLACLLLSLGNMHPSALQMALDMLARIGALEEIQEILLSENQIVAALRIADEGANPRKFLSVASKAGDGSLLHTVLVHFRNNPQFAAALKKGEFYLEVGEVVSIVLFFRRAAAELRATVQFHLRRVNNG